MSIDNIEILPFVIKELYKNSLIENIEINSVTTSKSDARTEDGYPADQIRYLGNNSRNILIIIDEKEHAFLGDAELSFLIAVFNACTVTMENIALVNSSDNKLVTYENLMKQFRPAIVLFFGIEPQHLGFPVQIPMYQVQQYNKQQYMCAPALQVLAAEVEQKKLLWAALKKIFMIG
jgi:hypothetical protein